MTESGWGSFFDEPLVDEDGLEAETTDETDDDGLEAEVHGRPVKTHQANVNLHGTPVPAHRVNHTF